MKKLLMTLGAVGLTSASVFATETSVSLPSIGVDVGDYITVGITALGGVVAVAIGGYAAFLIVKKGLAWMRKAM